MSESEAQSTQKNKVVCVRRIIKYDVPDNNNYSDTIQELQFVPNMSHNLYPVDGTTFEEIQIDNVMHIDNMKPDVKVIPEKDNVKPTDKDETIVVHFTPIKKEKKVNLDESDKNGEESEKTIDDPVSNIAAMLNQQFESETPEKPQIILNSDTDSNKNQSENTQNNDFSKEQTLDSEIQLENTDDSYFKDIQKMEQEKVSDKTEIFLTSLNIPVTKRDRYLITRRHRNIHPIPLSQDKAWMRSIPQVCKILSNLQQIGEIDMTPDSYDMWYYRH